MLLPGHGQKNDQRKKDSIMNIIVVFVLWFVVAEALLTAVQLLLRKKKVKPAVRVVLAVVKVVLAVGCAVLVLAGPVFLRKVQPLMMALYVALLADGPVDLVCAVIDAIRKGTRKFAPYKIISLLCGVIVLVYGIWNMQTVKPTDHTYTSEKLTQTHTIVFAADLHVGSAQPFETTKKTVDAMIALHPDCIILGGDITDDYTTKEEMEATFALFKDAGVPVYYIYGNHDLQGHAKYAIGLQYTKAEFEHAMAANGITILADAYEELAPDVVLLGRQDFTAGDGRADAAALTAANPNPDAYLVVIDHQPTGAKDNLATGMDLQLSGHTHAGQLFPLRALYALIGGYVYGDYDLDGATLNVSAGVCGWRMPLRTDAHCSYEVITLKPATAAN